MHPVFRVLFAIAAMVGSGCVLFATINFYRTYGVSEFDKAIYTGFAGMSAFATLALPSALVFFPRGHGIRKAGWTCFAAAAVFNILGVIGFVNMTRGASVEAKGSDAGIYRAQKTEVDRLRQLADEMAKVRVTGAVQAELRKAQALAPDCDRRSNAYRDSCKAFFELSAEEAEALERDRRETAWQEAKAQLDGMDVPNVTAADPQGVAFAPLTRIGIDPSFFITLIVSILTITLGEFLPVVCSYIALHGGTGRGHNVPTKGSEPAACGHVVPTPRPARRPRGPPGDLLATLRGVIAGTVTGDGLAAQPPGAVVTNRALARASGVSASKVNTELQTLAAAGKVDVRSGPGGTYVELKP